MISNIPVGVCPTIAASLSHNAYGSGSLNPCLDRQNKVVAACRIPNCIEFGTIKIWVIQFLPFSKVFNSTFKLIHLNTMCSCIWL